VHAVVTGTPPTSHEIFGFILSAFHSLAQKLTVFPGVEITGDGNFTNSRVCCREHFSTTKSVPEFTFHDTPRSALNAHLLGKTGDN
jgi:hypothetical protein